VIRLLQRAVDQLRRMFAAEPAQASEPKSRGGRPRKYVTPEEERAAAAKRQAEHRARERQKHEQEQRKKAEQRTVGQLVKWQDSEGFSHFGIVQEIDGDGRAVRYKEIAVDANGNPRKYENGQPMWLENVKADEPQWPAPPPVPVTPPLAPMPVGQPAPVIPPPPSKPAPEPIDNADCLGGWWASRGSLNFKPDITQFFLVNGTHKVEAASRMGQLAVAIPRWHSDYDETFSPVTKLWVAMTRSDGAWLNSLLTASPAIHEKMRLCVCDDIQVLLGLKLATDFAIFRGQHVSVYGFYNSHFKPMPENAEQAKALLQSPMPQPVQTQDWQPDWRMGGSAGSGGYSGVGIEVPSPGSNPHGSGHGNDGSGFAF
jgi:hypothetical protein